MNIRKRMISLQLLSVSMLLGLCFSLFSCSETETTDSTKFALFYSSATDIAPSMSMSIPEPTYIGSKPSDFEITGVLLNGETYKTDSFEINPETGSILIKDTKELATGKYSLSVACLSNGKYHVFSNIVSINMMRNIPEGISLEPNELFVDYGQLLNTAEGQELPTAKIITEGSHISITKYTVSNVYLDGVKQDNISFIKVSKDGVVYLERTDDVVPGKYTVDFKLTTAVVGEDSEDGLFAKALTINVTSKPLELTYFPNEIRVEVDKLLTSVKPVLVGFNENLSFEVISTTPSTDKISIDQATGEVSVDANGLNIGDAFKVGVKVTNKYGSSSFDDVLDVIVVDFIEPITEFSYGDMRNITQAIAFEIPVTEIVGDGVSYSFVDLGAKLSDLLLDPVTGTISAKSGNTIPVGRYEVKVLASNSKGSKEAVVNLNIEENKNMFTFVSWGNNLNLEVTSKLASQYRVNSKEELTALSINVAQSDIANTAQANFEIDFELSSISLGASIDASTGEIKFTEKAWVDNKVQMIAIRVTVGKGTQAEVSSKIPVFLHCSVPAEGVRVNYTPFVMQVNPMAGGTSVSPTLEGVADPEKFIMAYRRTFNYYNINGPESQLSGQPDPKNTASFLSKMWKEFFEQRSLTPNYGSREPMYFGPDSKYSSNLVSAYVDMSKKSTVVVSPNKWRDESGYANGVVIGQMTFDTNNDLKAMQNAKDPMRIYPIAIWFDLNF